MDILDKMNPLRIVLPDQLDYQLLPEIESRGQTVLIAETGYLFAARTHRRKLALLAAAGRHYAQALRDRGVPVHHETIAEASHERALADHIARVAAERKLDSLLAIRPGSWSELAELERASRLTGLPLTIEEDAHFFSTPEEFAQHAKGRKRIVMEYFYRELRKRHNVLMDGDDPVGGEWNYDTENRESFGKEGPGETPVAPRFEADALTAQAVTDVRSIFPDAPGSDDPADFGLAVTPEQAAQALRSFVDDRLESFGRYQDAMWTGGSTLYHSLLSPMLNLRLLDPREAVAAAEKAWRTGRVPVNSAEGFIRQILGWREFVRGVYYLRGPEYEQENALGARTALPSFFWDGETEMACVNDVVTGLRKTGYSHHIQRLMVMGLLAMQLGADPREVHEWHLAMHLDAYDWVSSPNVLGMSQYADGGYLATKPYAASGNYIHRMGNYCKSCPFSPKKAHGDTACPFTTLYWDFLARHQEMLEQNRRMNFQVRNLARKDPAELRAIQEAAGALRSRWAGANS